MRSGQLNVQTSQPSYWNTKQLSYVAGKQNRGVTWAPARLQNQPVLQGDVKTARINSDCVWHFANAAVAQSTSVGFEQAAGVTVGLLYEGQMQLELNNKKHLINAATAPQAFFFASTRSMAIKRYFQAGTRAHKFTLFASYTWLCNLGLKNIFAQNFCDLTSVIASRDVIEHINLLISSKGQSGLKTKLQQTTSILTLLTLATTDENTSAYSSEAEEYPLTVQEKKFLLSIDEIIHNNQIQVQDIHIESIARVLNTSASSAQRLAKKCFGKSLVRHIREAKLANAHEALLNQRVSIGEASFIAGYSQTSNFSLAFKKTYGFPPGELKKVRSL